MDLSSEVAKIHMRTDANHLVTTARTIHLPEQKKTIHMISMSRKEACSRNIHDLFFFFKKKKSETRKSSQYSTTITRKKKKTVHQAGDKRD